MGQHDTPPIWMQVSGNKLVPCSNFDEQRLGSYGNGARIRVTLWQGRNSKLLRKYWAVLNKAVKACKTPWQNAEEASDALKLALGITDTGKTVNDQFFIRPGSISFSAMDEADFQDFFEKAMAVLQRVTGVDPETLTKEADSTGEFEDEPDPDANEKESASEPAGDDGFASASPAEEGGDITPPSPPSDENPSIDPRFIHAVRQILAAASGPGTAHERLTKATELKEW